MVVDVVQAVETDGPEILALRHAAEDWLAERGIIQWRPREVSVEQVGEQISRGEFFVARDREQSRIVGALRLIWSDPVVWPDRTSLPATCTDWLSIENSREPRWANAYSSGPIDGPRTRTRSTCGSIV